MARHFQKLTFNLTPANKRYETLDGKQYLVVPAVMLTEGVHTGSKGPLLYLNQDLAKNPTTCNMRPAVVYHPQMRDGEPVSGTEPAIIERQGVGQTMNTVHDGKLRTEVWFDENKLQRVDRRVYDSINRNKPMEVSTGLFHDLDETPGTWNGEKYTGIVRNMVLDHLAILPDQKGACSIEKGAGLLVNAMHDLSHNDVKDHLHAEHNKTAAEYGSPLPYSDRIHIHDVFPKHVVYEKSGKHFKHEYGVKNGKAAFKGEPEEVHKQTTYVTANGEALVYNDDTTGPVTVIKQPTVGEISPEMRRQQFQKNLSEKLSGAQQNGEWGGWVQDVLANHVVWSKDGKLFRLPYTYDADKVKLGEDPEEVERVEGKLSEYRRKAPIDGTQSPYAINFSLEKPMATQPPTKEQIQLAANKMYGMLVNTLKLPPQQAQAAVQNAIHQGAHQLIHDATQHMDAHHAPGGASDSQLRTTTGGARKDAVDKLVGGGKWREEDRQFLTDLPDDHFERVQKNALAGATNPIIPFTYEGVGDRSNAHTANQAQSLDQWLAAQPTAMQPILRNALGTYANKKNQLTKLITNAKGNRFTPETLGAMDIDQLEAIAALIPQQTAPVNNGSFEQQILANYAGQGGVGPVFDLTQPQQVNNNDIISLPLPQYSWADEKTA